MCVCEEGGGRLGLGAIGNYLATPVYMNLTPTCKSVIVTPTVACPQVMDSEYLVSTVVGTFIGTTLLYTMILIVSICALIYWNKKHR